MTGRSHRRCDKIRPMNQKNTPPTLEDATALALASPQFRAWRPSGTSDLDFTGEGFGTIGESWHNRGDDLRDGGNKSADAAVALERHFEPAELGKLWGLSDDTIRRIFESEDGVLRHTETNRLKRKYVSMRIPESVAVRVHRKMSKV